MSIAPEKQMSKGLVDCKASWFVDDRQALCKSHKKDSTSLMMCVRAARLHLDDRPNGYSIVECLLNFIQISPQPMQKLSSSVNPLLNLQDQ